MPEREWLCAFLREWVCVPARAFIGQPILIAELGLLIAILVFGKLKAVGAPLHFLHEDEGRQRSAGFATTLTVGHIFFVAHLGGAARDGRLLPPLVYFAVFWSAVLVAIASGDDRPLTPGLRRPAAGERPARDFCVQVRAGSFVQGALWACVVLAGLAGGLLWIDHQLNQASWSWLLWLRDRGVAPAFHLVALVSAFIVVLQVWRLRNEATPAGAVCLLLSGVAASSGALRFYFGFPAAGLLPLLVVFAWAGRESFSIRLAELAALYEPDKLVELPEQPIPKIPGFTLPGVSRELPGKQPLILVCVSGGGIRAATWTAGMLARLNEASQSRFQRLTVLVTGASGGMVGSSYWVAERQRAKTDAAYSPDELMQIVSKDSLTTVLRTLLLNDIPRSFLRSPNLDDRGSAMQRAWVEAAREPHGLELGVPLSALREDERSRNVPSLVFSPMIVEDGRRLLISNLRLDSLVTARARWLSRPEAEGEERRPEEGDELSVSAWHAADLFGEHADQLTLATAARLSASFPYISPAAVLPTSPRVRVVDAGYYDNYGVDLATDWLRRLLEEHRAWLEEHVSSVLVLQIRDQAALLSRVPGRRQGFFSRVLRALEGLTTPPEGLLAARSSVMALRNDAELDAVTAAYEKAFRAGFCRTEIFELKGEVSLSWSLSKDELGVIQEQVSCKEVGEKIQAVVDWIEKSGGAQRGEAL